jgi:hypothetical protein
MGGQTQATEHDLRDVITMAELNERWAEVKNAIDDLLDVYHSIGDIDDDRLEEICENFELKIDFDSPLAIE